MLRTSKSWLGVKIVDGKGYQDGCPFVYCAGDPLVVVYRWPADLLNANADNVEMVLVVAIQGTEAPMK